MNRSFRINCTPDTPSKISASGLKVHLGRLTDFSFRINSTPDTPSFRTNSTTYYARHDFNFTISTVLMRRARFQLHDQQQYTWYAQHDFNFRISSMRDMPSMISSSGSTVHVMHPAWFQISRTSIRLAWFQLYQMINMFRWSTVHLIPPACVFRISVDTLYIRHAQPDLHDYDSTWDTQHDFGLRTNSNPCK